MNAVRRHLIGNKYKSDLHFLMGEAVGDAETTATATSAVADLLKAGGGMYAEKQAKDAAAKKAADEAAKQAAADKDKNAALADYKVKAKTALDAQADAHAAQLQADALEPGQSNGPYHIAAKKAADKAAIAAAQAQAAQDKLAYYSPVPSSDAGAGRASKQSGLPWWGWGLIGLGTVAVGGIGYTLIKGRK